MKTKSIFSFIICLLALSFAACSNPISTPVTATLTQAGPLVSDGMYVGPYVMTIEGLDSSFAVMCIDPNVESYLGVSYQATVTPLATLDSTFYDKEAWLYDQLTFAGQSDDNRIGIQDAAWGIYNGWTILAGMDYQWADLTDLYLVAPDDSTAAQPFIAAIEVSINQVPEPGLFGIVGIAMIGLAVIRRKKGRAGRYVKQESA